MIPPAASVCTYRYLRASRPPQRWNQALASTAADQNHQPSTHESLVCHCGRVNGGGLLFIFIADCCCPPTKARFRLGPPPPAPTLMLPSCSPVLRLSVCFAPTISLGSGSCLSGWMLGLAEPFPARRASHRPTLHANELLTFVF